MVYDQTIFFTKSKVHNYGKKKLPILTILSLAIAFAIINFTEHKLHTNVCGAKRCLPEDTENGFWITSLLFYQHIKSASCPLEQQNCNSNVKQITQRKKAMQQCSHKSSQLHVNMAVHVQGFVLSQCSWLIVQSYQHPTAPLKSICLKVCRFSAGSN